MREPVCCDRWKSAMGMRPNLHEARVLIEAWRRGRSGLLHALQRRVRRGEADYWRIAPGPGSGNIGAGRTDRRTTLKLVESEKH